jgi:hypothetical protein
MQLGFFVALANNTNAWLLPSKAELPDIILINRYEHGQK